MILLKKWIIRVGLQFLSNIHGNYINCMTLKQLRKKKKEEERGKRERERCVGTRFVITTQIEIKTKSKRFSHILRFVTKRVSIIQ